MGRLVDIQTALKPLKKTIKFPAAGTEVRDPRREVGPQTQQDRNPDAGQELHHGVDQHRVRYAGRRQALPVSAFFAFFKV